MSKFKLGKLLTTSAIVVVLGTSEHLAGEITYIDQPKNILDLKKNQAALNELKNRAKQGELPRHI